MNNPTRTLAPRQARRVQMLMATLVVAAAASLAPPVHAQPAGGMHGGGMRGEMGMAGPYMGRMLDKVNATADQRAQIKAIMTAAHTDLKAQADAGRALHQQLQAAFALPTIDARSVESLRAQISAQHDAASKRMTQAMLDASQVLTADQRKTLSDLMAKRQALMQRQASERATLDKSTQ